VPKTARPLRSIRFHRSVFIRVLAQQGHDLALFLPLCVVEGRLAAQKPLGSEPRIGSQRRICASFEETLGDREVTVVCRAMQS
jgi:hypothetical protein